MSSKAELRTERIYKKIQDKILSLLTKSKENDEVVTWLKYSSGVAKNIFSNTSYRGFNQIFLSMAMDENKFKTNKWLTFKQASELGGNIIKGSKSEEIVFYNFIYKYQGKKISLDEIKKMQKTTGKTKNELGITSNAFIKFYNVFNIDQIENLDSKYYEAEQVLFSTEPIEKAELLFLSTGAKLISKESSKAFYHRTNDTITMPLINQFETAEDYYNVLFHETSHWTGAKHRLNRKKGIEFGDENYAFEELVAELSTAFINNSIGLTCGITKNVNYIHSWLGAIKGNVKYFISACALAQKSADYVFELEENYSIEKVA